MQKVTIIKLLQLKITKRISNPNTWIEKINKKENYRRDENSLRWDKMFTVGFYVVMQLFFIRKLKSNIHIKILIKYTSSKLLTK